MDTKPARRPPPELRPVVLDRDGYRCVDCRPAVRLPASLLEVDHDIELADGGTNDPANLVTRCLDHHDAKTQERRMARTATPSKPKPSRGQKAAASAHLPDQPTIPYRLIAATSMTSVGGGMVGVALGGSWRWAAAAWAVITGLLIVVYVGRWVEWRRMVEAQRVYEQLCGPASTAAAARKQRFKAKGWDGFTPIDVMIQPSGPFTETTQAAVVAAFAAAVGAQPAHVKTVGRHGWLRMTLTDDYAPASAPPAPVPAEPPSDPARDTATARISDALLPLVNGAGRVRVTDWWDDAAPRAVELAYAPGAAMTAREARADLGVLLTDVYPPRAQDGRWHVRWEPAHDRFRALDAPDPLAPIVPMPPIEDDVDLVAGPVLGVQEDGSPWRQPLLNTHVLVAGATGAGKGSVLWGIIRGVHAAILDGRVRLWVIDPKGGMELGLIEPIAHRFATGAGASRLLADAAEAMDTQAQALRAAGLRKLETPTRSMPLNIVIVDELAALTALAPDTRVRNEMNATMGRLLTQGRAVGFTVIGALQDPRQKNLDNRNLFPYAVALRLKERQMIDMVLGAGARASGALCDMIPRALPGVGYVVADGMADTLRVRAAFVPDEEVARLAEPARTPPEHAHTRVSEQLVLDAPTEPASDLEVPADAPTRVRIEHLAEGARVLFPDDPDPVTITDVDPDPDDPENMVEVTYVYDGETGQRCASFDRGDYATFV